MREARVTGAVGSAMDGSGVTRSWADRVHGSLLLSACGDALGAPFEGRSAVEPAVVDRWLAADRPLRWTDDTALTLALADHLARRGGSIDEQQLAADFAAEWARDPHRGYGAGAAEVFAQLVRGTQWSQAAGSLFDGAGSFGNGAAMRVAPVGLMGGVALAVVAGSARRSAGVTHAHPLARDGATVQAVAVALTARSTAATPLDADGFVAAVTAHAQTSQFRAALPKVGDLTRRGASPAEVAAEIGNDVSALSSVPAALAAFLSAPDDARAAIRFAICIGGDTDSIAAMTGALSGARLGEAGLPARWRARLEAAPRIAGLADQLAGLAPLAGDPADPAGGPG